MIKIFLEGIATGVILSALAVIWYILKVTADIDKEDNYMRQVR